MHMWMYVYMCDTACAYVRVHIHMCVHTCGGLWLILGTFLDCPSTLAKRQGLLIKCNSTRYGQSHLLWGPAVSIF